MDAFIKKVKGGVGAAAQQVIGTGGDCEGGNRWWQAAMGGGVEWWKMIVGFKVESCALTGRSPSWRFGQLE